MLLFNNPRLFLTQILCAPNSNWIKFDQTDNIPPNALLVPLGTDSAYIGRSVVSPNKIYIGTIKPKEGMTVDFYGESAKLTDCEILVSGDVDKSAEQEVTNGTKEHVTTEKPETNMEVPEESTESTPVAVFNYATDDSPTETEIETDSGLIEYEELEEKTAYDDECGTPLEQIEERDENV